MKLKQVMDDFITLAIQSGGWMELDRLYLRNRLLSMIGSDTPDAAYEVVYDRESADSLSDALIEYAGKLNSELDESATKAYLKAQLLDLLTPPPSVVNAFFAQHYSKEPEQATDYFYKLNQQTGYIHTPYVSESYQQETMYGTFLLRILEGKKEPCRKQDQDSVMNVEGYPACRYCFENEGFYEAGKTLPARRLIRMNVAGESWGFQFSEWEEYREKFIVSSEQHEGLSMSKGSISRMTQLLDIFPHYFFSFTAAKTAVHGYYEGGREALPIAQADIETYIELKAFPLMNIGALAWPFPVIRLQSPNPEDITEGIDTILQKLRQNLKAGQLEEPLIVGRKKENLYEFDILLVSLEEQAPEEQDIASFLGIFQLTEEAFRESQQNVDHEELSSEEKQLEQYIVQAKSYSQFGKGLFLQDDFTAFLHSLE